MCRDLMRRGHDIVARWFAAQEEPVGHDDVRFADHLSPALYVDHINRVSLQTIACQHIGRQPDRAPDVPA